MNYWESFKQLFKKKHSRKHTGYKLSIRSRENLAGVHPDLVAVAIYTMYKTARYDFAVIDGVRTKEEQARYLAEGSSLTKNSKHLPQLDGLSHAIDIMIYIDGVGTWDHKYYLTLSEDFKEAARELNVDLTWGGDWKRLVDGGHFEI